MGVFTSDITILSLSVIPRVPCDVPTTSRQNAWCGHHLLFLAKTSERTKKPFKRAKRRTRGASMNSNTKTVRDAFWSSGPSQAHVLDENVQYTLGRAQAKASYCASREKWTCTRERATRHAHESDIKAFRQLPKPSVLQSCPSPAVTLGVS